MNWIYLIPFLILTVSMSGQEIELTTEVSSNHVKVGESFTYTIKLSNVKGEIQPPELAGFGVISGPNYATSLTIINGKTNMSSSFSCTLVAFEEGEYNIESASVMLDDGEIHTEPIPITVTYDPNYNGELRYPIRTKSKKRRGIRL